MHQASFLSVFAFVPIRESGFFRNTLSHSVFSNTNRITKMSNKNTVTCIVSNDRITD
jgi:hypothetical protein